MADSTSNQLDRAFQRRLEVGKHLMMMGNLAASALLFGQALSNYQFNLRAAILGVMIVVFAYVGAWVLMKGGGLS